MHGSGGTLLSFSGSRAWCSRTLILFTALHVPHAFPLAKVSKVLLQSTMYSGICSELTFFILEIGEMPFLMCWYWCLKFTKCSAGRLVLNQVRDAVEAWLIGWLFEEKNCIHPVSVCQTASLQMVLSAQKAGWTIWSAGVCFQWMG